MDLTYVYIYIYTHVHISEYLYAIIARSAYSSLSYPHTLNCLNASYHSPLAIQYMIIYNHAWSAEST